MRRMAIVLSILFFAAGASAEDIEMPQLVGKTVNEARAALAEAGLVGKVHITEDEGAHCDAASVPQGKVCAQNPPAGRGHLAVLDVFLFTQDERTAPKLRVPLIRSGTTADRAREILVESGFTGPIEVVEAGQDGLVCHYPDRAAGEVCGQEPGVARDVPADGKLKLVVQGERTKWDPYGLIPNVIGMDVVEALRLLNERNFTVLNVGFYEGADCPPMEVCDVGYSVSIGGHDFSKIVAKGVDVRLVVGSRYPEAEPEGALWPDFHGDTLEAALVKADASGFNSPSKFVSWIGVRFSEVDDLSDAAVEPGHIARQKAPAGWRLRKPQVITVAERRDEGLKEGKQWKRMPSLIGLEVESARRKLDEMGVSKIDVEEKPGDPDCVPGIICGSSPAPEERAFLDGTQLLFVGGEVSDTVAEDTPKAAETGSTDPSAESPPEDEMGDFEDAPTDDIEIPDLFGN